MTTILKLDDFFTLYGNKNYSELGIFLDFLRSLYFIHQTNHWQTNGNNFFSDHLLFERISGTILKQIDKVAEKAIGLGESSLVDYKNSLENMPKFIKIVDEAAGSLIKENSLIKKSLTAEQTFVTCGELLMKSLESNELLTRGVEQLLGTILDEHEEILYLLQQRNN